MTVPAPAPAPAPAQSTPSEKWNVLSIVGFVLSVIGINVVAIVLGFVGLNQVKKTGERGRGLALAAVIVGFVWLVLTIVIVIAISGCSQSRPQRCRCPSHRVRTSESPVRLHRAGDSAVSWTGGSAQCTSSLSRNEASAATAGARPDGSSRATSADARSTAAPTMTAGSAPTL